MCENNDAAALAGWLAQLGARGGEVSCSGPETNPFDGILVAFDQSRDPAVNQASCVDAVARIAAAADSAIIGAVVGCQRWSQVSTAYTLRTIVESHCTNLAAELNAVLAEARVVPYVSTVAPTLMATTTGSPSHSATPATCNGNPDPMDPWRVACC